MRMLKNVSYVNDGLFNLRNSSLRRVQSQREGIHTIITFRLISEACPPIPDRRQQSLHETLVSGPESSPRLGFHMFIQLQGCGQAHVEISVGIHFV